MKEIRLTMRNVHLPACKMLKNKGNIILIKSCVENTRKRAKLMKLTKNKIEIHIIEQSKTILDSLFLYLKFSKLLIYVNLNKVQQ